MLNHISLLCSDNFCCLSPFFGFVLCAHFLGRLTRNRKLPGITVTHKSINFSISLQVLWQFFQAKYVKPFFSFGHNIDQSVFYYNIHFFAFQFLFKLKVGGEGGWGEGGCAERVGGKRWEERLVLLGWTYPLVVESPGDPMLQNNLRSIKVKSRVYYTVRSIGKQHCTVQSENIPSPNLK